MRLRLLAMDLSLDSSGEAASELLVVLRDLVQRSPPDLAIARSMLVDEPRDSADGMPSLLSGIMRFMGGGNDDGVGDMTFVHACGFLAVLASGDQGVCRALRGAGLLELAAGRLLRATSGRCGVPTVGIRPDEAPLVAPMREEWPHFAAVAVSLLEVLILEEEPDTLTGLPVILRSIWEPGGQPRQAQIVPDALLAALDRSLVRQGGSLVVQQMHVGALRSLGQLVRICRNQVFLSSGAHKALSWNVEPAAQHLLRADAPALAARVLALAGGTDECGTAVALWFLAELSEGAPTERGLRVGEHLRAVGAAEAAARARSSYPSSEAVQRQAERVSAACERKRLDLHVSRPAHWAG